MWAQLTTMRLKPGNDMAELDNQIWAAEQPGSRLVGTLVMHDQKAPCPGVRAGGVREPGASTRPRAGSAARKRLHAAKAMMADIFDGPPQFTDLTATDGWTGPAGDPWVTPASLPARSSTHSGTSQAG